jgi:hypothetical protein
MRSLTMPELIAHASSLSVLVPLILYLTRLKKLDRPMHIIGALLIVAASCDLAGFLLFQAQRSTAVVFNIYYTLMFLILSVFYYETVFKNRYKTALVLGIAVYVLSYVLITFYVQEFFYYQNLIWIIAGIILILYSITCFVNSISSIPSIHLFNNSTTWFNTGVLFYFSFSLFLFSLGDYLFTKQDSEVTLLLWTTHNINNFIKNILFAIGMTMIPKKLSVHSEIEAEEISAEA